MRLCFNCFLLALLTGTSLAANGDISAEQQLLEDWFNDDSESKSLSVNEGQLTFIQPFMDNSVLHSKNVLHITQQSLQTGWIDLQQCYSNLDPVAVIDIVYQYRAMRALSISSTNNIKHAEVIDQSVRLHQVQHDAELCISAEIQVARKINASTYEIVSGPFHRRFLDGYYPYRVSLDIRYPDSLLSFSRIYPDIEHYHRFTAKPGHLSVDAWFEGILKFKIQFQSTSDKNN